MKAPVSWLKEYVDIDADVKKLAEDMTLTGSKAEGYEEIAKELKNIVVGRIKNIKKHPDAEKLFIVETDAGQYGVKTIVTGASNLFEGAFVPVALDGSTIADGKEIKKDELRGVVSEGMLCSVEELGFDRNDFPEAPEHGIYIFPNPQVPGSDVVSAMDLRDDVIEFEITSNRPDCFSIIGLAREAAATYKKEFKYPKIEVSEKGGGSASEMIDVEIKNADLCPRYIARVVTDVKIEPSPRWMRKRLKSAGLRPINNIVDITNYVMLELGQPMHAFDIDTIGGSKIIVRNAAEGEKITTLDGHERKLDPSMLVIADKEKAVAVAGVMGGENSMVSGNARAILFESANFEGTNIRLTAKKLGMRTDASSKYEKGLDPNLALDAVNRAVQLVELLGAGKVVPGMVDRYVNKREPLVLSYSPEKINALIGEDIPEGDMLDIFERLGFEADISAKTLVIPTFRPDVCVMADITEEVARFYGYDRIRPTLASGTPTAGKRTRSQKIVSMIKDYMASEGLCEAMIYSFESPKVFDKLLIEEGSPLRGAVAILNPLGEDFSIMRTLTLNGMLSSISTNYNRRNEKAWLFETGKVYTPNGEIPLPGAPEKLTVGMYGEADYFTLKGIIEGLLNILGIKTARFEPEKNLPYMHGGRTARILINGENIGYIGEFHPKVLENYEIGTRAYAGVLDIEALIENARLVREYKPLPKFPAVSRDIAVLTPEAVFVEQIEDIIKEEGKSILESVNFFDVYRGLQIPKGYKSVAYSLKFRASDRTLTDDEVNPVMNAIVDSLKLKLGAVLRDK